MLFDLFASKLAQSEGQDLPAGCVRVFVGEFGLRIVYWCGQDYGADGGGILVVLVGNR